MLLAAVALLAPLASMALASTAGDASCLLHTKLFPGVQIHDRHPAVDLGNKQGLTEVQCAEWCCSRADCKCWYHTSNQTHDGLNCKAGQPCCWLKPTFNTTRVHDDGDCHGPHKCLSGVRGAY